MTSNVDPTQPVDETQATTQTDQKTAPTGETTYNASTTIGSMSELHEKAPKLEQQMLLAASQRICKDVQKAEERRRQIWREANNG